MPITGKFVADFASFQDAVQKATVSLVGMETGAGKVSTGLNRMVDSFSGRKIIQEAELMSQTFELLAEKGIGLTNRELQRMGGVAEEAIAKLRAGGQDVPPGMQRIADAAAKIKPPVDAAQTASQTFFNTLKSAAGLVGIAFSAQGVINFAKHVFDTASQIGDLSDQLGISAEAAQRFKFAAEQSGSSLDAIGTAIGFMNKTLAGGDASTVGALKAAGLGFQQIRSLKPEDAFVAIADAVKGIEDPMEQARIVTELFGLSAAELLPAIKAGIKEVGDTTTVMSDSTVADLKRASDAWAALGNWVTVTTGTMIADTASSVAAITKSWENFRIFVGNAITMGPGVAAALASITESAARMEKVVPWAIKEEIKALVELGGTAANIGALFPGLEKETQKFADSLMKTGPAAHQTAEGLAAAKQAAREYEAQMDRAAVAGVKAFKDHQVFLKEIADQTKAVNVQMGILVKDRLEALGSRGQRILQLMTDESVRFAVAMTGNLPVVEGLGRGMEILGEKSVTGIKPVPPLLNTFKLNLSDLSQSLSQLAQVAGGSFGTVASGLATLVAGANTAKTAIENLKQGAKAGFSLDGILGMATGISGIVSAALAAVNAIKSLWSVFDRNKGRDLVVDFAESFGGFDALHAKLLEIGDAGEALWVKLTQGVGSNNPDQAARVIAEVEAALARQAEAQGDVTNATEEQAQATIETATQAAKALDELEPKLKSNADSWRTWGDAVTAQIQKIADGLRGLTLPGGTPAPAFAGAVGGGGVSGLTRAPSGSVVLNNKTVFALDGEVVAESVARRILWS